MLVGIWRRAQCFGDRNGSRSFETAKDQNAFFMVCFFRVHRASGVVGFLAIDTVKIGKIQNTLAWVRKCGWKRSCFN